MNDAAQLARVSFVDDLSVEEKKPTPKPVAKPAAKTRKPATPKKAAK